MPGPSSINRLPPEVKATVDRLLRADVHTQTEILAHVNDELTRRAADPVSRSALSRYAIQMRAAGHRLAEARAVAKQWIGELGEEPAGEVGRLMIELIRTLAFDAAGHLAGEDAPAPPQLIAALARSVRDLETAARTSAEREIVIRRETAKAAAGAAEKAVTAAGKEHSFRLPAAALKTIREQIYGIVERPA